MNIADEILTDYSFLSKYHYAKSKNYLKKTISNSSLNSHVYWDTLYIYRTLSSTNHPCRSLSFFYDYAYAFSKTLTFLAWILSFSNLIVLFSHVVWDSNALQSACRFSIVTSPAEYSPHTSRVQYSLLANCGDFCAGLQGFNSILKVSTTCAISLFLRTRDLSLCHILKFSNPYILATWWCKPLIFQT